MQKRQVVINRLKAMAAFDDPLVQLLTEQIGEIDEEINNTPLIWIQYCVLNTAPPLIKILIFECIK
jgi:hypothetical protein